MAKTIAEFVFSKIRRTETEALMRFEAGGAPDAGLGACEGTLTGPAGTVVWYERGIHLADGSAVPWDSIAVVRRIDPTTIELLLKDQTAKRIIGSAPGAEIVFATLRWIGSAILRNQGYSTQ